MSSDSFIIRKRAERGPSCCLIEGTYYTYICRIPTTTFLLAALEGWDVKGNFYKPKHAVEQLIVNCAY